MENKTRVKVGRGVPLGASRAHNPQKMPVPFRETRLTHLLIVRRAFVGATDCVQDILSGNFVLSIILNASSSPAHNQDKYTSQSMAFGSGARRLTVQAKQNIQQTRLKHWLVGVWKSVSR